MNSLSRKVQLTLLAAAFLGLAMCSKNEEAQTNNTANHQTDVAEAPADSNRGVASATFGDAKVSIDYGRPQLQGRDMLARATEGMVWRMGMNEATEIKTDADLKFGETVIPKGSYSLWMKKGSEDKWELVFNKKTGIWGHAHPAEDDFASVPLKASTSEKSVETFTIELTATNETAGMLKATWGTTIVSAEFTVNPSGTM
jgi:hypothetical protein